MFVKCVDDIYVNFIGISLQHKIKKQDELVMTNIFLFCRGHTFNPYQKIQYHKQTIYVTGRSVLLCTTISIILIYALQKKGYSLSGIKYILKQHKKSRSLHKNVIIITEHI